MDNQKNVVLLLTGCIKPNVTDVLRFTDPEAIKKQHVDAINWYLANAPYRLMFVENSGTNISCQFAEYSTRTGSQFRKMKQKHLLKK